MKKQSKIKKKIKQKEKTELKNGSIFEDLSAEAQHEIDVENDKWRAKRNMYGDEVW
jgi:hypothetical protein